MGDQLCPVCACRFEEGSARCPQCGRPRPGVLPEYMNVPWQRAATYIGLISLVLFVLLLILAPRDATEPSATTTSQQPEAEPSVPSESGAHKEAPSASSSDKDIVISSWNCTIENIGNFANVRGELKNASGSPIKSLGILVSLRTADGTFVSSTNGNTEYDVILPGQTSPFDILVRFNPAVRKVDLSLERDGQAVELSGPHSGSCSAEKADL